jgi:hypothetical protein
MLMMVQGTTPKNSSIEVQHCTALMVTLVCFIQPSMTAPSLAILSSAAFGNADGDVALDGGQLGLRRVVVSFMRLMRPKTSDRSRVSMVMPLVRDALGVAHRVEGRGTRADGADAQILQALHDAADLRRTIPGRP